MTLTHSPARALVLTNEEAARFSESVARLKERLCGMSIAKDGHLNRELFMTIGAAGVLADRWAFGRARGVTLAVELVQRVSDVDGGLALAVSLNSEVVTGTVREFGRSDYLADFVADLLSGDAIGCFALTEVSGGSDIAAVQTVATHEGATVRLRGRKRYISNAGTATHALVLARTESGHGLYAVPLDAPGVVRERYFEKAGVDSCDATELSFDVELPSDALVGPADRGLALVQRALFFERLMVAAVTVSAARRAVGIASAYARVRTQFGKRLIEHEALSHRLAESDARTRGLEAHLDAVVHAIQTGKARVADVAALKLVAANTASHVIDEALQLCGARGYTGAFGLSKMWRDVRLARIGAGTDEVLREVIVSRLSRPDPPFDELIAQMIADDESPYGNVRS